MTSQDDSNQAHSLRYSSLIIDGAQEKPDGYALSHPLELLEQVWRAPFIAQYIKYITFVDRDKHSFEPCHVDNTVKSLIREFESAAGQLFLRDCIQNTPLSHHPKLWGKCLDGILAGKQSSAFMLLLVVLPQLERLRFSHPRWDLELLSTILTDASFSSKLSIVECYHSDTENYISVENYMIFALAPSIRVLRGRTVGEFPDWSKLPSWETAISCLERLELTACAIDVEDVKDVASLLRPLRNLKEFRYYGDYLSLCEGPFETQRWVDGLAETVSQTLEVMTLTCVEGSTLSVKTFKMFKKLRELEIDVKSLVRDVEDDISNPSDVEDDTLETGFHQPVTRSRKELVPRLLDILPPSIEKIDLIVRGLENETKLLLRDLVSERACLPNLKAINLGGFELEESIKNELDGVGITIGQKQSAIYPDYVFFWERDPPLYDDWLAGRPC